MTTLEYKRAEYRRNKATYQAYYEQWKTMTPWKKHYRAARSRCCNPSNNKYSSYGAKGIIFYLTVEEVRLLWIRDKAHKLIQPSLDRIISSEGYSFLNCRFIEMKLNAKLGNMYRQKRVLRIANDGKEKIYLCVKDATRDLGIRHQGNIDRAIKMGHKNYGYTWRYV